MSGLLVPVLLGRPPRTRRGGFVSGRIAPELAGREWYNLLCPGCLKWALLAEGGEVNCRFCESRWNAEAFPLHYAVRVLQHFWRDYRKTPGGPAESCPECGAHALIGEAHVAASPGEGVQYCFGCSTVFQGLDSCMRCGQLYEPYFLPGGGQHPARMADLAVDRFSGCPGPVAGIGITPPLGR